MFQIFSVIVAGTVLDSNILRYEDAAKLASRFAGGVVVSEWVSQTDPPRLDRLSNEIMAANQAENFVLA